MSRGRTKQRLTNALPVAVVVLGAGVTAAKKLRAARHARHTLRHPVPVVTVGDAGPSVVAAIHEVSFGEGVETTTVLTGLNSTPTTQATSSPEPAAGPVARGATTANVLGALAKGGTMTAGEVALATGIGRATASSTLSRLTRTGQVTKADRGYQLPDAGLKSKQAPKTRSPKAKAAKPTVSAVSGRTTPGATKAKVLAALSPDAGMTASEVALAIGLGRGTVSTTLSKLAKNGEIVKADRGYRLPA